LPKQGTPPPDCNTKSRWLALRARCEEKQRALLKLRVSKGFAAAPSGKNKLVSVETLDIGGEDSQCIISDPCEMSARISAHFAAKWNLDGLCDSAKAQAAVTFLSRDFGKVGVTADQWASGRDAIWEKPICDNYGPSTEAVLLAWGTRVDCFNAAFGESIHDRDLPEHIVILGFVKSKVPAKPKCAKLRALLPQSAVLQPLRCHLDSSVRRTLAPLMQEHHIHLQVWGAMLRQIAMEFANDVAAERSTASADVKGYYDFLQPTRGVVVPCRMWLLGFYSAGFGESSSAAECWACCPGHFCQCVPEV
jgi:hypothetical protein